MKPSSRRMRAISTRIRLTGTETVSCRAPAALRTRVSMSATEAFDAPAPFGRTFLGAATFRGAGRSGRGSPCTSLIALSCSSFDIPYLYQLDFVTPGSSPMRARSRKQIRQRPNFRMKPRGRPQTWHRLWLCTLCRGGRRDFRMRLFLAISYPSRRGAERHPEAAQQRAALFVRPRRGDDRDLES